MELCFENVFSSMNECVIFFFFFGNKYLKYRHRDDISFPRGGKNKWKNDIRASSYLERVIPGRKQQCLLPGYFFRIFFFFLILLDLSNY